MYVPEWNHHTHNMFKCFPRVLVFSPPCILCFIKVITVCKALCTPTIWRVFLYCEFSLILHHNLSASILLRRPHFLTLSPIVAFICLIKPANFSWAVFPTLLWAFSQLWLLSHLNKSHFLQKHFSTLLTYRELLSIVNLYFIKGGLRVNSLPHITSQI